MGNEALIVIMFVALLVGLFLGGHLAFVLGAVGIGVGYFGWGPGMLPLFTVRMYGLMGNYILVAIPLFVFMGCVLERSGLAEDLYGGMETLFRRLKGGLASGTVVISASIAACTGIIPTGIFSAGVLALPSMLKRNYDAPLSLGTIAAGGCLGIIIPPSVMLVFYASQTNLSVGRLFLAAFSPGFLLAALYIVYITIICTLRPQLAPTVRVEGRTSATQYLRAIRGFVPIIFLIGTVLGVIILGIATPTEAAGTGALGAIVIAAAYRRLSWEVIKTAAFRTLSIMGMVGAIMLGAICFSTVFLGLGGKEVVENIFVTLHLSPMQQLGSMMFIMFILGMFIDWWGILYLVIPIFTPIAAQMGWDPVWFALLMCLNLQMAFLTPPFGYALFYVKGIAPREITTGDVYRGCFPFVGLQALGLVLCIVFPQIVLWLPNLVFK